jgi:hypothetical protein
VNRKSILKGTEAEKRERTITFAKSTEMLNLGQKSNPRLPSITHHQSGAQDILAHNLPGNIEN